MQTLLIVIRPLSVLLSFLLFSLADKQRATSLTLSSSPSFESVFEPIHLVSDTLKASSSYGALHKERPSRKKALQTLERYKSYQGKVPRDSTEPRRGVHFSLKTLAPVLSARGGLKTSFDSLKVVYKRQRALSKQTKLNRVSADSLKLQTELESRKQVDSAARSTALMRKINPPTFKVSPKTSIKRTRRFFFPLEGPLVVTSPFGSRVHPLSGKRGFHRGIDFRASYQSVLAVLDAQVVESGWDPKGGGYYMSLKHSDGLVTSYLHLSERYYSKGEKVLAGYIIARSGNSGGSSGPHLHFCVRKNGSLVSPQDFLLEQSASEWPQNLALN